MKTLSGNQNTRRLITNKGITWIAWIDVDGTTYRYSTREITLSGNVHSAILLSPGTLSRSLGRGRNVLGAADNTTLVFDNTRSLTTGLGTIEALQNEVELAGRPVTVGILFDPAAGENEDDIIWLGSFLIDTLEPVGARYNLVCVDALLGRGEQPWGRVIRIGDFPNAEDTVLGSMMPLIIGMVPGCPLIPVDKGASSPLEGSILANETGFTLSLQSVEKFPDFGTVVIGEEQFYYSVKDDDAKTLGVLPSSPVQRALNSTIAADHPDHSLVVELQDQYDYLVADHPCGAVTNVRLPGTTFEVTTDYSLHTPTIDGREVQLVRFGSVPRYVEVSPFTTRIPLVQEGSEDDEPPAGEPFDWEDNGSSAGLATDPDGDDPLVSPVDQVIDVSNPRDGAILAGDDNKLRLRLATDLTDGRLGSLKQARVFVTYLTMSETTAARIKVFAGATELKSIALAPAKAIEIEGPEQNSTHTHIDNIGIDDTTGLFVYLNEAGIPIDPAQQVRLTLINPEFNSYPSAATRYRTKAYGFFNDTDNFLDGSEETLGSWDSGTYSPVYDGPVGTWWPVSYTGMASFYFQSVFAGEQPGPLMGMTFRVIVDSITSGALSYRIGLGGVTVAYQSTGSHGVIDLNALNLDDDGYTWDTLNSSNSYLSIGFPANSTVHIAEVSCVAYYGMYDLVGAGRSATMHGGVSSATLLLRALSSSSLVTQTLRFTDTLTADDRWDKFDGTIDVEVSAPGTIPEDPDNDQRVLVTQAYIEVEVKEQTLVAGFDRMLADVSGVYETDGDVVLTNPSNIMRRIILTNGANVPAFDMMRLTDSDLDTSTFDTAWGRYADGVEAGYPTIAPYQVRRRISQRTPPKQLIEELCEDTRSFLVREGEEYKYIVSDLNPIGDVTVLDEDNVISVGKGRYDSTANVFNDISLAYNRNEESLGQIFDNHVTVQDAVSQAMAWGLRSADFAALWLGNDFGAFDSASYWLSRLSRKWLFRPFRCSLELCHLDRGDPVIIDLPRYGLHDPIGIVHAMSITGLDAITLTIRLRDWTAQCWSEDNRNYVGVTPGNQAIVWYVGGRRVASLTADGDLKVSELQEAADALGANPGSDPFFYASGGGAEAIGVSYREGGGGMSDAFLYHELTNAGAIRTVLVWDGETAENVDLSGESPSASDYVCISQENAGGSDGVVWFTLGSSAVAKYDPAAKILSLAGEVIEGAI